MQLQAEVDQYRLQNSVKDREVVSLVMPYSLIDISILKQEEKSKREKDTIKWNTLMEEIAKYKAKVRLSYFIERIAKIGLYSNLN